MQRKFIWLLLVITLIVPIALAAASPLLAWREPIYIIAGFAGIVALCILLMQPLLIGNYLPGLSTIRARQFHRWLGAGLVTAVLLHVIGLWITSPPDVIDVLLFRSPTPFSVWGVIAMWAVFLTAFITTLRKKLRIHLKTWQYIHFILSIVIVIGTAVHAILIQGTMETISKSILSALVVVVTVRVLFKHRKRTTQSHTST